MLLLPEYSLSTLNVIHRMDALSLLRGLRAGSVDTIITDPPYNMTELEFEQAIDWGVFWQEARRVLKRKNSPVILFSQQPFTTDLICSNRKGWRYEIIWHKTMPVGFLDANRRPLRCHENIQIFADAMPDYYPQMSISSSPTRQPVRVRVSSRHYGKPKIGNYTDNGTRYPRSVWTFAQRDSAFKNTRTMHPTQKPLDLMTELVLTYTRAGDVILDPFAGSGSTLVAARGAGRNFIGCDLNADYVALSRKRLQETDPYQHKPLSNGLTQMSLFSEVAR